MPNDSSAPIRRLLDIMATLRDPAGGCPWDREQTFATIAPYTIEEAYEVADAIEHDDLPALKDELGDLLFQVVFHARMAQELGAFAFADVVENLNDKMVRRHPHVFGDVDVSTAAAQTQAWEAHKAAERTAKAEARGAAPSALDGVAAGLPALTRALKLQARAARVGFDWPETAPVLDKIAEEIGELHHEIDAGAPHARLYDEFGDLLFALVNLGRHLKLDPEGALRAANHKFERRFRRIEDRLAEQGRRPQDASLTELDTLWDQAKSKESSR